MARYINGTEVTAYGFAFDGCHKFYLIENDNERRELEGYGYRIYKIEDLPLAWCDSCPLRFILSADLKTVYVAQCEPAEFDGWDMTPDLEQNLEWLANEQRMANACCGA